jgi:hypothetical protein
MALFLMTAKTIKFSNMANFVTSSAKRLNFRVLASLFQGKEVGFPGE